MSQNPLDKFKVSFTLKQHTPIIHFQSEQSGATLRSTELKPKLDRFLLKQVEDIPFIKNANGHRSLDYKVKIEAKTEMSDIETINSKNGKSIPNPLFFGNMGEGEKKRFSLASKIEIEFFSFNSEVLKAIRNNFEAFLAYTNFGTRQSKGFGSFYVKKPFDATVIKHKVYSFSSSANSWQEDIKFFYAFLRAGINTAKFRGIYAKAVIFSYAKSKNITWDKKAIKNYYLDNNGDIENQKLMRDLFGLSSSQSWMSYRRATITKDDPTKEITRFKSPITFKPILENGKMRIYFWADTSVEKILNKEFLVKFDRKSGLKLKTPTSFTFDDFFDFAFNLDLSKHIDSEYHNNDQYKKLVRMFNEIKESK
ncbi:MAG: hypothetical protein FAF03_02405 [Epsilonproteobacteria bacterium]|nr:hypothetical protein [Campylobacterota bacterium]